MTNRNYAVVENLENSVFVVMKHAAGSAKMLVDINVATAKNHIDNEQIINAICDTGIAYFRAYNFGTHGSLFCRYRD